jgi:hypothetical protein
VGWFNNKICYMVTPQVEDGIWYGEKSLDGAIENQWSANRQRDQKLNAALHDGGSVAVLTNIPLSALQQMPVVNGTNTPIVFSSGAYTLTLNTNGLNDTNASSGTWSHDGRTVSERGSTNTLRQILVLADRVDINTIDLHAGTTNTLSLPTNSLAGPTWNGMPLLTNMTAAQVIAAGGLTNAVTILNSTNGYYTWTTNAGGQMTGTWVPTNTPAAALTGTLPMGLLTSSGTNLPGGVLVTDGAGNRAYTNNLSVSNVTASGTITGNGGGLTGLNINGVSQTNPVVYQFAQTNIMFIGTNALGVPFTNFWVQGTGTSLYTVWQLDNVGYTSLYTVGTNGQYTFNQQVNSGTVSAGSVSLSPIFRGSSSASAFTLGASTTPNIFVLATNLNSGALVNNFTNGITSFSTNSITVGSTGLTNTLGKTIVVNFTVGTGCSLFNNQGIAEFSSVAVGAGTQWRVQANGWITGTAITATADAW